MTVKISNLPAATSVGSGDVLPVVQSGTTKKIDLNSPWSINIDGGNIDGTPIGANSADEGNFTTLDASGDVNFDSGQMFFDASANSLGIRTSTPSAPLHIVGEASGSLFIDGTDSIRPSTDDSLITISGGNATNSGANYSLFGGSHPSLAKIHRWRIDGSEAMRIDSSGHAIIPQGVTLGTAAGVYNAANTLDDYEEGDWNPIYVPQTGSFGAITYSNAGGFYTKVGRVVMVNGFIRTNSITVGTASGSVKIGGLPFTPKSNTVGFNGNYAGTINTARDFSGNVPISCGAAAPNDELSIIARTSVNGDAIGINVSDLDTGTNKNVIIFSCVYLT